MMDNLNLKILSDLGLERMTRFSNEISKEKRDAPR